MGTEINDELSKLRRDLTETRERAASEIQEAQAKVSGQLQTARIALDQRAVEERRQHPTLRGNAAAVAIHHFGGQALNEQIESPLAKLEEKILLNSVKGHALPVLLVSSFEDWVWGDSKSGVIRNVHLVRIEYGEATTPFESTAETRRQLMHAFTGVEANVEHLVLALVGRCVTARGTLLDSDFYPGKQTEKLILRHQATAEGGHGCGMPGGYAFTNYVIDEVMNFASSKSSRQECYVGWAEIDSYLAGLQGDRNTAYGNFHEMIRKVGITSYGPKRLTVHKVLGELDRLLLLKKIIKGLVVGKNSSVTPSPDHQ